MPRAGYLGLSQEDTGTVAGLRLFPLDSLRANLFNWLTLDPIYSPDTLWRHSGNQAGFWGLIPRVTMETLWRHSGNQPGFWGGDYQSDSGDTLETL